MHKLLHTTFCCFFLGILYLRAQDAITGSHYAGLRVYHENDFIVPFATNTDDNYTGGLKAEIITNLFKSKQNIFLNPLKGNFNSLSFVFGVTAFTPQDLKSAAIIRNDRPYASYRYWGIGVSSVSPDTSWKLYYELQFGAMGRPLAGDAQSYIHRHHWFGSQRDDPMGWDNQIGFDGTMAINVHANLERKLWSSKLLGRKKNFRWIQVNGRGYVNAGQYMINFAAEPRISLFNWNHKLGEYEDEPILPAIAPGSRAASGVKRINKAGFHIFIGTRPRFIVHNATLTGKLLGKSSAYTIPSKDIKRAIMEYDLGLMFRWCFFRLGYNVFSRSKEFSYQNKAVHGWGGVYTGFIFQFQ